MQRTAMSEQARVRHPTIVAHPAARRSRHVTSGARSQPMWSSRFHDPSWVGRSYRRAPSVRNGSTSGRSVSAQSAVNAPHPIRTSVIGAVLCGSKKKRSTFVPACGWLMTAPWAARR